MSKDTPDFSDKAGFATALADNQQDKQKALLRLFVSRRKANSIEAETNFIELYESHLKNDYHYEIIDILENPAAALEHNVPVVPMLIKVSPEHSVTIIGNLRDKKKILTVLQMPFN